MVLLGAPVTPEQSAEAPSQTLEASGSFYLRPVQAIHPTFPPGIPP